MAERRMFAKSIVLSDAFLDMPLSARCLYFTLGMLADDDGFVGNPKALMRQVGATQDDMLILLQKRFVLSFDSGVIVIKHWKINNYLRNDRHTTTNYKEELSQLMLDNNNAYTEKKELGIPSDNQVVDKWYTEDSIGKDSIGKVNDDEGELLKQNNNKKEKTNNKITTYPNIIITEEELNSLKAKLNDFCEGVPSWKWYLGYMNKQGQDRGKKYTYSDIIGWYEQDKQKGWRTFTQPSSASYDMESWKRKSIEEVPKYERKKK